MIIKFPYPVSLNINHQYLDTWQGGHSSQVHFIMILFIWTCLLSSYFSWYSARDYSYAPTCDGHRWSERADRVECVFCWSALHTGMASTVKSSTPTCFQMLRRAQQHSTPLWLNIVCFLKGEAALESAHVIPVFFLSLSFSSWVFVRKCQTASRDDTFLFSVCNAVIDG